MTVGEDKVCHCLVNLEVKVNQNYLVVAEEEEA